MIVTNSISNYPYISRTCFGNNQVNQENQGSNIFLANDSNSIFQLSVWNILEKAGYKKQYHEIVKLPSPATYYRSMAKQTEKPVFNNYNNLESLFKVYPNPADDYITIEYAIIDFSKGTKLRLSDMQGRTIKQIVLNNQIGKIKIDVTDLEKGIYVLSCGNKLFSKKINIK